MKKKKANKSNKSIYIIVSVLVVLLLGTGYYYFIYQSDDAILDRADKKINNIEENITLDEANDGKIKEEINKTGEETDNDLDELEASLNGVLDGLQDVEDEETNIGSSVE